MIDLNDPTFYGLWFMDVSDKSDWLAALFKKSDGHEVLWRIRYHRDDKTTSDSVDMKNWFRQKATPETPFETSLEHMRLVVRTLSQHARGECFELIKGDKTVEEFTKELKRMPWAFFEEVKIQ